MQECLGILVANGASQAHLDCLGPSLVPAVVGIVDQAGIVDQIAIKGAEAVVKSLKRLAHIGTGELLPTRGSSIDLEELLSGQRSHVESK